MRELCDDENVMWIWEWNLVIRELSGGVKTYSAEIDIWWLERHLVVNKIIVVTKLWLWYLEIKKAFGKRNSMIRKAQVMRKKFLCWEYSNICILTRKAQDIRIVFGDKRDTEEWERRNMSHYRILKLVPYTEENIP